MHKGPKKARKHSVEERKHVDELDVDGIPNRIEDEDDDERQGKLDLVHVVLELGLKGELSVNRTTSANVLEERVRGESDGVRIEQHRHHKQRRRHENDGAARAA